METLIYLRRSVVDDDNPGTVSYDQQLERCREIARKHGADEPAVLVDWGRSGGAGLEHRRGAYQELRERIATGGVRWVVSYDLSRLSRSTRETLDLIDHARKHGAKVHVGDLGILDPDDPVGKFTVTTLASANALLRDMASKRAKETVESRRAQGLPIGRPPFGARPGEDAAVVLAAYDEAGSYHAAARLLNARGVSTRMDRGWQGRSVQQVVRRERPRDVTARPRTRSRGRYILTGLLRCHCGATMRVMASKWGGACVCGRGSSDPAHSRPVQISPAKLMPWIREEAARMRLPEAVEMEIRSDEVAAQKIEARRVRVLEAFYDGVTDKAERDRQLAKLDDQEAALGARQVVLELPPAIDWGTWSPGAINRVLRSLWQYVELGPDLRPVRAEWLVKEWRA